MKILFYLGHPAHFHLFKNVITSLLKSDNDVKVLIKKKDILEKLLIDAGISFTNILAEGRKDSKFGILCGMIKRDIRLIKITRNYHPDILVGTSVENSHVTKLFGIPSININEDDASVVPFYAKFSYPWATEILNPVSCDSGKWDLKAIKYKSFQELGYLHPNHFTPDKKVVERYFSADGPYFIIRFAKLKAHHDDGIQGINKNIALRIIDLIHPHGKVYITSERELEPELESFRININPLDMHHIMAYAKLFIGDSQTMAAEAGVLGTPFVRFNDFVGRIGYLAELEDKYQLGYGIKPDQEEQLFDTIRDLLSMGNLREEFQKRRQKMLSEKIDCARFLTWFIENYPESSSIMKSNPDYQYNFR